MSLTGLRLRTQVIQTLKTYLSHLGFEEIEPQLFVTSDTLEPTIYPFVVGDCFLSTSPEAFLKQAMAAGIGNCFAISHTFRDLEGQGSLHAPNFIMAEWYQQGVDYHHMIHFTQELIQSILPQSIAPWPIISWRDLWSQTFNTSLDNLLDDQAMIVFAKDRGYNPNDATWEQLFNQLADTEIVPKLSNQPFFLIDYPSKISPLAKPRHDLPNYAQRFELFFHRIELANGNTENFDTSTIRQVMLGEQASRPHPSPLNQPLLAAIDQLNGQTWSGVGLGVDRLAMLLGNFDHISRVNSFH